MHRCTVSLHTSCACTRQGRRPFTGHPSRPPPQSGREQPAPGLPSRPRAHSAPSGATLPRAAGPSRWPLGHTSCCIVYPHSDRPGAERVPRPGGSRRPRPPALCSLHTLVGPGCFTETDDTSFPLPTGPQGAPAPISPGRPPLPPETLRGMAVTLAVLPTPRAFGERASLEWAALQLPQPLGLSWEGQGLFWGPCICAWHQPPPQGPGPEPVRGREQSHFCFYAGRLSSSWAPMSSADPLVTMRLGAGAWRAHAALPTATLWLLCEGRCPAAWWVWIPGLPGRLGARETLPGRNTQACVEPCMLVTALPDLGHRAGVSQGPGLGVPKP